MAVAKLLLLSFFIGATLALLLFPHKALLKLAAWKLSSFGQFSCESFGFREGACKFYGVSLRSPSQDITLKTGTFKQKCLELEGLEIHLKKQSPLSLKDLEKIFLNPAFETQIRSACFHIEGFEKPLAWTFEKGCFTFFLEEGPLCLEMGKTGEQVWVKTSFEKRELAPLFALTSLVLPPQCKKWEFFEGNIEAQNVHVAFVENALRCMSGDVVVEDLLGKDKDHLLVSGLKRAEAKFYLDFFDPSQCNGTLFLDQGSLYLDFCRQMTQLYLHQSTLTLKEGKIEKSKVNASFLGMEGELVFHGSKGELLAQLEVKGTSEKVAEVILERYKAPFQQAFKGSSLCLNSTIRQSPVGTELEGKLTILESEGKENELCFGAHFAKEVSETLREKASFLSLENLMALAYVNSRPLGWLRGNGFSVEKFFSPFLVKDKALSLKGTVDFEATFDESLFLFYYRGSHFVLDSPQFRLECAKISSRPHSDLAAFQWFDLKSGQSEGFLPLTNASFWQKKFDFTLQKGSGGVYFKNGQIAIREITTHYQDLLLEGEVNVLFPEKKRALLTIAVPKFSGSLQTARELSSHFAPLSIWNVPLTGSLKSKDEGLICKVDFGSLKPASVKIKGEIAANLGAGLCSLKNYCCSFDFDKEKNYMLFEGGKGEFFFGKTGAPFEVAVPQISLTSFPDPEMKVELEVTRFGKKVCHLLGNTASLDLGKRFFSIQGDLLNAHAVHEGQQLHVDQFQWGDCNASGVFDLADERKISSQIALFSEDLGEISLSGEFDKTLSTLSAKAPHLYLNIQKVFDSYLPLQKWATVWNPHGKILGEAELLWDFAKEEFQVSTSSCFSGLSLAGIQLSQANTLKCHFSSQDGLVVEGLEVDLPEGSGKYQLGKLHYQAENQKVVFDEFAFSLPKEKIAAFCEMMERLFPGKLTPEMIKMAEHLKKEDALEGKLSMELSPGKMWMNLSLKEGLYLIGGKEHHLKDFFLTFYPEGLNISTYVGFRDAFYYLGLNTCPSFQEGVFSLKEHANARESLQGVWKKDEKDKWHLTQLEGKFLGIEPQLTENTETSLVDRLALKGSLKIDWSKAKALLPLSFRERIDKYGVGGGYCFEGDFLFSPREFNDLMFSGKMRGSHFGLASLCLEQLSAEVLLTPSLLEIKNLNVNDCGGHLEIERAEFNKREGQWDFFIPKVKLMGMRLSRLYTDLARKKSKSFLKFLHVQSFELKNAKGIVGQSETIKGSGELLFNNVEKKSFFSNLFYLPSEITARLGLDLNLLVPVRGRIGYEIHEGKIHFLRFKSMYSEGKRSRFYLAEGYPATLDFDGTLNLKVKMKQYNLLMKIAELFVVTVKGTLKDPDISFTTLFEQASFDEE